MTGPQFDAVFVSELRSAAAAQLPEYLSAQRWFRGKARTIRSVTVADCVPVPLSEALSVVLFVRVEFSEGREEIYVLPLLQSAAATDTEPQAAEAILRLRDPESSGEIVLSDAFANPEFPAALLAAIQGGKSFAGQNGELEARSGAALSSLLAAGASSLAGRILKAEQSNTSIVYGDRLILKFYRAVEEGINPELEVGRFLTETAHFAHTPPLGGWLEYHTSEGRSMTLGILQGFVPNQGDAWSFTLRSLNELLLQAAAASGWDQRSAAKLDATSFAEQLPGEISARLETHLAAMALLGQRTAEMHRALSAESANEDFSPEPFTPAFCESLRSSLHDMTVRNFDLLRANAGRLPEAMRAFADKSAKLEENVLLACHTILEREFHTLRTRIHGDYHLGQILFTGSDFLIIDFEGEPARPLQERRAKRSPLQDVAGVLRSFHYAERCALLASSEEIQLSSAARSVMEKILSHWRHEAGRRFVQAYRASAEGSVFLPQWSEESEALLRLHLLEKAVYELGYELNNRPAWLAIPWHGIEELAR